MIRHWLLLRTWLDDSRAFLKQKRKIQAKAEEWKDNERSEEYLLPTKESHEMYSLSEQLSKESKKLNFSDLAKEFIDKSYFNRTKYERFKMIFAYGFFGTVLFLFVGVSIGKWINWWVVDNLSGPKRNYALQNLVQDHSASLAKINLSNADLRGIVLSFQYSVANLSGSNLSNTNLSEAYLAGTNLSETNLQGSILHGSDLSGANLRNSNLRGANLRDAKVNTYFDDRYQEWKNTDLRNADLRNTDLTNAKLIRADLRMADLRTAKLNGTDLKYSLYDKKTRFPEGFNPASQKMNLIVTGSELKNTDLFYANLNGLNLQRSNFRSSNLISAKLNNTNLSNSDFSAAKLTSTNFESANLKGVNFQDAEFGCDKDPFDKAKDISPCTNFSRAKNLTPEQVKAAKNWEKAEYDDEFRKKLGLK
ncbi:MAG: pentapeptide repeat-containing protein [Methylacidiphilales bacterium]|nr:pentapeptide repeat-containing protein [Candidatus Methylacidiphilales bacterium]